MVRNLGLLGSCLRLRLLGLIKRVRFGGESRSTISSVVYMLRGGMKRRCLHCWLCWVLELGVGPRETERWYDEKMKKKW